MSMFDALHDDSDEAEVEAVIARIKAVRETVPDMVADRLARQYLQARQEHMAEITDAIANGDLDKAERLQTQYDAMDHHFERMIGGFLQMMDTKYGRRHPYGEATPAEVEASDAELAAAMAEIISAHPNLTERAVRDMAVKLIKLRRAHPNAEFDIGSNAGLSLDGVPDPDANVVPMLANIGHWNDEMAEAFAEGVKFFNTTWFHYSREALFSQPEVDAVLPEEYREQLMSVLWAMFGISRMVTEQINGAGPGGEDDVLGADDITEKMAILFSMIRTTFGAGIAYGRMSAGKPIIEGQDDDQDDDAPADPS